MSIRVACSRSEGNGKPAGMRDLKISVQKLSARRKKASAQRGLGAKRLAKAPWRLTKTLHQGRPFGALRPGQRYHGQLIWVFPHITELSGRSGMSHEIACLGRDGGVQAKRDANPYKALAEEMQHGS